MGEMRNKANDPRTSKNVSTTVVSNRCHKESTSIKRVFLRRCFSAAAFNQAPKAKGLGPQNIDEAAVQQASKHFPAQINIMSYMSYKLKYKTPNKLLLLFLI